MSERSPQEAILHDDRAQPRWIIPFLGAVFGVFVIVLLALELIGYV